MSMSKKQSGYNAHCIIQWYARNHAVGVLSRDQANFISDNNGSQSLTAASLELSHANAFNISDSENKRHRDFSPNSYKISPRMANIKKASIHNTTDLFLYGHSTYRSYITPKHIIERDVHSVRGISVDGHYVSAAKMAIFLDMVCKSLRTVPLRVWLLSCHTSGTDLFRPYDSHLADKLKSRDWKNKQIIGFRKTVTVDTLGACRKLASKTPLFLPLSFSDILNRKRQPRVITF